MDLNKKYNLNSRVKLEKTDSKHISIVKLIKSRIIKKDAEKILAQIEQIKKVDKDMKVSLVSTKNICSKSTKLLNESGVEIIFREI